MYIPSKAKCVLIAITVYLTCATGFVSAQLPLPPVPVENPITQPKRVLGKILFWEEQLSSDNTVACGTCHSQGHASSDRRLAVHPGLDETFATPDDILGSFGVVRQDAIGNPIADPLFGFDVQVTGRSAQPVSSGLWSPLGFWDGRADSEFINPQTGAVSIVAGGALESQAVGPILSDVEMAHEGRTWPEVITKLETADPMLYGTYLPPDMQAAIAADPTYPDLFAAAFGDPAITAERIAYAIATYERTLVPNQTPFDLGTLTPQQQQGLNVFLSTGSRCFVCHTPPFFTDNSFRNIGLRPIPEDPGRIAITGVAADAGRFKVPGLRNVGLKRFYMHNGVQTSLEEVIDFYLGVNGQVQFPANQDGLIPGIAFPPGARIDLIEFLRNGLTDPRTETESFPFDRPILYSDRGDNNLDAQVDLIDYADFENCFTGDGSGPVDPNCQRLDMDGDTDIDCTDLIELEMRWSSTDPMPEFAICAALSANAPTVSQWGLTIMAILLVTAGTCVLRDTRMLA